MKNNIIDLTMSIREEMQIYSAPWHPSVEILQLGKHDIEKRETRKVTLGTHTGTHVDAPRHFIPNGNTIDKIQLDNFIGKATVIDFSYAMFLQEMKIEDLENALQGRPLDRIIIRFDWDKYLDSDFYFTKHPFLSTETCEWLVSKGCKLIALDTPQPDSPHNGRFSKNDSPNHKILLAANVIIVEYLINIKNIHNDIVDFIVAPLKIENGDGAPARCFAIENY